MDIEEQYNRIYRYCYMKTRDHHTSEDLTQDTFLHFLENHIYREAGKQMTYLYVIARNLCNDYYRSGTRNEIPTENKQEKEVISSNTSFEQVEILDELERLDPLERELILLRYINEEFVGRIAELTQMSRFSVYRRIQAVFLSQVLGNHSAAMGVMVLELLLSLLNVPENFRVISQIWRYMPGAFIGTWTFTDYRLTKVFGHYLNIFQMAPVVVFLIVKMSYDRYQVKGR